MTDWGSLIVGFLILCVGLRLSAFFSGTETGFYRVSLLRLKLDAQSGDRIARDLIWYAKNPSYFVATTLVGNNLSHYLITLAVGWLTYDLLHRETVWIEIGATLTSAPVVFIVGELAPKSVYYRIPLQRLRGDLPWFNFVFYLLLPLSTPLIALTRLMRRLGGGGEHATEMALGRAQLVQLLSQGHQIGLLTDVQSRLIHGLFHTAAQSVTESMTPPSRILGLPETATTDEAIEFTRRYGLAAVPVRRAGAEASWHAYVRAAEAAVTRAAMPALLRAMPRIDATRTKLEALLELQHEQADLGLVTRGEQILGLINLHGLTEQLMRPPQSIGPTERLGLTKTGDESPRT